MTSLTLGYQHGRYGGILSALAHVAERAVVAWRLHRAEQELESLPFDVMKDIGFPAVDSNEGGCKRR